MEFKATLHDRQLIGTRVKYVIGLTDDPLLAIAGKMIHRRYGKKAVLQEVCLSYSVWRVGRKVITIGADYIETGE